MTSDSTLLLPIRGRPIYSPVICDNATLKSEDGAKPTSRALGQQCLNNHDDFHFLSNVGLPLRILEIPDLNPLQLEISYICSSNIEPR
ncbi:hypothetical protein ACN38_g4610 [Penicillium nordicum]|uniref:Uncharacterized protein n=1 Tax=Penicillium nordicum TaxID=229535 RepID=A0A0M8P369_9EURO|nr:hypothetical protein ACN38_g4610 [Penicillium nordicum]